MIMGRQKLKKTLQYEIKWKGLDHKFNTWLAREDLIERGFVKLVRQFDDLEASREGTRGAFVYCAQLTYFEVRRLVTPERTTCASIWTKSGWTATSLSITSSVA